MGIIDFITDRAESCKVVSDLKVKGQVLSY